MSDKILFINFDTGNLIDNEGALIVQAPSISYKAYPSWEIHFVRVFDDGTLSGVDMTAGVSYNAAVDLDFNINTQPIIRTLDTGIDHTQAASGIFTVGLDAGTEGFLSAVNGRNSVQGWFEFRGYNSEDRCLYDYRIKCNCLGAIDPNSGEPLPVVSGGVTLADVYALLRSAPEYQYSSNGTTWHPTQQPDDIYYQTRYDGGDWSSTIEMIKGADGTDGEDGTDGTNGVGFKVVGEYNAGTTYHPYTTSGYYEVVTHNGSSYAYINATASSGHEPSGTDSYWELIAAKGDTGSVENITVSDITDFDSTMSGILSGYALKGESYTIAQSNTLLAAKANASDVYTTEEADNKFVDIDELSEATGNLVTVSQWTNQNATFQDEIDYLSGVISGGGDGGSGDLSNYYTKSEVNSISAYLQNEIDNIPAPADLSAYTPLSTTQTISGNLQNDIDTVSGNLNSYALTTTVQTISGTLQNEINTLSGNVPSSAIEGVNLNNERTLQVSNIAWVLAMPMRTVMPDANDTDQDFMFYVGNDITISGTQYIKAHLYEKVLDPDAPPPSDDDIYISIPEYSIDNVKLTKVTAGVWTSGQDYQGTITIQSGQGSQCEENAWTISIDSDPYKYLIGPSGSATGGALPWEVTAWLKDMARTYVDVFMTHYPHGGGSSRYHWEDISPWATTP